MFAALMGLVAAGLVWALERDQLSRLHVEIVDYLEKHDKFKEWEAGGGSTHTE